VDSENGVVERGIASEQVRARADAINGAMALFPAKPDPYPEGRQCHNISFI